MKKLVALTVVLVLAGALGPAAALAQGMKWRGSGGWGAGGPYARMYNPKTVETVSGEIVRIERLTPMRGMSAGMHAVLKTATEEISVHLGPAWYLENQDVRLAPRDAIQVRGSRVRMNGASAIIAAEVKKGEDTLRLRDEAGVPYWSGWRRG